MPRPRFSGNASTNSRERPAAVAATTATESAHQLPDGLQRYPFAADDEDESNSAESESDGLEGGAWQASAVGAAAMGSAAVGVVSCGEFDALMRWDCALQGHRYEAGSRRCQECKKIVMPAGYLARAGGGA